MKKYLFSLAVMLITTLTSANAMSYEQAREQALFLTDKMAYELNLTEDQYDAAYEVNLDYLMGVNTVDDVYADYWNRRNLDMSYILLDWQYRMFCDAAYFYRPLYWDAGCWHFGIYARYPHRDYFYFSHPRVYVTYRGGHAWHINGGRSWYHTNFRHVHVDNHVGMRDGWNRGSYHGERGVRSNNHSGSGFSRGDRNYGSSRHDGNSGMSRGSRDRNNDRGTHNSGTYNAPDRSNGSSGYNRGSSTPSRQSSTRTTVTRTSPSRSVGSSSMGSSTRGGGSSVGSSSMGSSTRGGGSSVGSGSHNGSASHGSASGSRGGGRR